MSQSESRRVAHCMYVEIEFKKKKNLILKVWFYENSVKLRQSPTHASCICCLLLTKRERERGRGEREGGRDGEREKRVRRKREG